MIKLKKPLITEKTIAEYNDNNVVRFVVDFSTNKFEAIKALEDTYGVTVLSARVINRLGKLGQSRTNRRSRDLVQRKPDQKIMVFKLKEGDKIDIFEESTN